MHRIVALLPMKGQSERVIGKNMRAFNNKPLCTYVLSELEKCSEIEKIVINTDCEKIVALAKTFSKVLIHERPISLQGHAIPMNAILEYDLKRLPQYEHFVQTHATNPLLTAETITCAVKEYFLHLNFFDSLFSVTPLQTRLYSPDGHAVNHNVNILLNTQDLPVLYEENSNIYIFSQTSFKNAHNRRVGLKPRMFEMSKYEAFDIDTESDFKIAEAAYKALKTNQG